MTPTETGLYGCPSDYPADFVTIDEMLARPPSDEAWEMYDRRIRRDCLLDLAEALDARGLFLTRINVVERQPITIEDDEPSSPNTGS